MPKQNWEAKADLIVNECFGEGATISQKTFDFVVEKLREQEQEVKERILKVLDDMFPESEFTRWNNFSNEWECLITKIRLKEITDLINKI